MTSNGHNGHNGRAKGTEPFGKVDAKPGMTEPIDIDRKVPCAARMDHGGWCVLPDGHDGPHEGIARQYTPLAPPVGWRKLLPAPRTWCRTCARPVPIVTEQGPIDLKTGRATTYFRIGAHNDCREENTLASEHPQFRG